MLIEDRSGKTQIFIGYFDEEAAKTIKSKLEATINFKSSFEIKLNRVPWNDYGVIAIARQNDINKMELVGHLLSLMALQITKGG